MRFSLALRSTASAAVMAMVAGGAAFAQEEPTAVEEIVVTAQKREQSLQDVPIVVTALSGEMLEDAGVHDIKDLQILTPGLTVTSTTTEASTTARIRGIGTVGDNPGLESSVGIVIDGVYRPRNGVGFGDLGELQRIEVLKGPQGTLFGKNTSAGVINILTEAPSFEPGFSGEATYGNFGAWRLNGAVTGPLSETVAGRLYVGAGQRDGFYDVLLGDGPRTLTEDADQNFWTARGQLLFLPSDDASIRIIADYTSRDENCCAAVQIRSGPTAAFVNALATNGEGVRPFTTGGFGPPPGYDYLPFSRTAYSNRDTGQAMEDMGLSAQADLDLDLFGGSTLTSITAWRTWETDNGMDIDYSGADIAYRPQDGQFTSSFDQLSQEFRLAGQSGGLNWLVGAFFASESLERNDSFFFGADYSPFLSFQFTAALNALNPAIAISPARYGCMTALGLTAPELQGCLVGLVAPRGPVQDAGQGFRDTYTQDSDTWALFTNNSWQLTDAFELTLGLRYTHESKSLNGLQDNLGTNGAACAGYLANLTTVATVLGGGNPVAGTPAAQTFAGRYCLPWTNPFYDNRVINEDHSDGDWSGTIKGTYRFNDDFMVYGSYARGYKGFGYNLDRVQTGITPNSTLFFPAETVDSYELGAKTTWLDGSLLFNATLFWQTFDNFQLNTFLGTSFVVESIPSVESQGVDMDLIWRTPVDGLSFQGGLTYSQTEYGNFTAADLFNPGNFPQLSLLPGSQMSFAPEWSGSAAFNYERSLAGDMMLGLNLAAKYTSEYNTKSDLLPAGMQEALTLFNGRISFGPADERWALELWGQNLTDEDYYQVVFNGFAQGDAFPNRTTPQPSGTPYPGTFYNPNTDTQTYDAFLGQPRTYGVTFRVRY
ncbi:TonB-dependent receptor [Brevundimonas sp. 2R-24]|uniref:TonB-dependent receptor n=1 Tax=Peiella sedimenti TaxID=3061083 RepID=A0ABT8SI54_9CAUL|nr:TonB-dependent receptor [Caulobacteraceae bacterium XZ-24]